MPRRPGYPCAGPGCATVLNYKGICGQCARKVNGKVVLVAGPPCGGKSTWVAEHAHPGDLVIDYDALGAALSFGGSSHDYGDAVRPFICEARDALLARLRRPHDVERVWVIQCVPDPVERWQFARRYGARCVVVTASIEECLRRADGNRPDEWAEAIHRWFHEYASAEGDELVETG